MPPWFLRSLRSRLAAWNTFVVVLTVAVSLVAVREGLRITLVRENDNELFDHALEMELAVERMYPDLRAIGEEFDRKVLGHQHRTLFVKLLDDHGQTLANSLRAPQLLAGTAPAARTNVLRSSGSYRLAYRQARAADGQRLVICVGGTLEHVTADIYRVTQMMGLVAAPLLALAPLTGYWLARRATAPVGRIIGLASRLRPSRLDERLPLRGTGDELDRLSQTINALLDRIALYVAGQNEFIANAAHELRSPLAAIQSSVEVALNSDRSTQEYKDLLDSLVEECRGLGSLVNQLLLLADADARGGALQLSPVRLDELVSKAVEMFRGASEELEVELRWTPPGPVTCWCDAAGVRQVVNNLIDNALKFTPAGGHVTIDLRTAADPTWVEFRVRDSGAGIAQGDLARVFERFFRADRSRHREREVTGTGLGLSICQAIVKAHRGRIEVHSAPSKGAEFLVQLPTLHVQRVEADEAAAGLIS